MTGTQAEIRLFADGAIRVEPFIRLTGSTRILCCTYEDQAPILAIDDGNVSVSLSVPDVHHVTGDDVNRRWRWPMRWPGTQPNSASA
jgi:hypothetical protein